MALIKSNFFNTFLSLILFFNLTSPALSNFTIQEATISDIQLAISQNRVNSKQLVTFCLNQIQLLNPRLRAVLEVNPDALIQAEKADLEMKAGVKRGALHGIPVLLTDSINTNDRLNTTCGSYALLGSKVGSDAGVVEKLRSGGAVILGKASLSEWYGLRSRRAPDGWCARGGQGLNPYVLERGSPCGSSSGAAISVAANMVAVSIGTETDSSIICPADHNSVVGIKPTVGLTSRAGVIPISPRLDTIGPICRTVSDAVYVLDAIDGFDIRDPIATKEAANFIPAGGYKSFLRLDGLKGKRIGVVRNPFSNSYKDSTVLLTFEKHLDVLRRGGATVVDNLEIQNVTLILDQFQSGEATVLLAEFKLTLNLYLKGLIESPVRSLADIIAFNKKNAALERIDDYGQELFLAADLTNGIGEKETAAIQSLEKLSKEGFEKVMIENKLDAMVTLGSRVATVLAIGGYPGISVPAGYDSTGMPFGICFGGLKFKDSTLIEIAYAFEQVTKVRKPPSTYSSILSN